MDEAAKHYQYLLESFNMGTATAENDPLLEKSMIETQEYHDLRFADHVDLVRGNKGAGKTAIYRVLYLLKDHIFERDQIVTAFGVETRGVPLFKQYLNTFEKFGEDDFERFWHCYFCYLAVQVLSEKKDKLAPAAQAELDKLLASLHNEDKELLGGQLTFTDRLSKWLKRLKDKATVKEIEVSMKPANVGPQTIFYPQIRCQLGAVTGGPSEPTINTQVLDQILGIIRASNTRLWILLDRLDEVFLRRSDTETRGLKGLLRAAYRFSTNPELRVKTFLREDIFETLAKGGFTSLTHIADRCSGAMSWSDKALLWLVSKRLANMPAVALKYGLDPNQVDGDASYQKKVFYSLFPQRIGKQETFDWLLGHLRDGKNQVTPRDLIDALNNARNSQLRIFQTEKKAHDLLIQKAALQEAVEQLSKDKREKYLNAEFPHLQSAISSFQGGRSDYSEKALEQKLGAEWRKVVEDLKSIGFLAFDGKKAIWKIPVIWRKGLDIRRGQTS
jgi:hypothetical protein